MILIALTCAQIPPGLDKLKRGYEIPDQTFHTPFNSTFESVTNIVFSLATNFGQKSIKSYQTVAMIKSN